MSSNVEFILPKETPDKPLYKYYKNLDFAVDAIENDRIHLDSLSDFNDLYEGAYPIPDDIFERISNPADGMIDFLSKVLGEPYQELIEAFRTTYNSETSLSLTTFFEFVNSINPDTEELIRQIIGGLFDDINIMVDESKKISCFSEVNDSLLMWAYYAEKYEGVCVQFDVSGNRDLFHNLRRVSYTDLYYGNVGDDSNYFRKSAQWQHEKEWRIVCKTEEEYLPAKVTGIYFTKRMKKEIRDRLIKLAKEKSIDMVLLYPRKDRYALDKKIIIEKGITVAPQVFV